MGCTSAVPSLLPCLSPAFAEGAPDRLAFLRLPPGSCQVGLVLCRAEKCAVKCPCRCPEHAEPKTAPRMGRAQGGLALPPPAAGMGTGGGAGTWKLLLAGAGGTTGSGRAHPAPGSPRLPPPRLPFRWDRGGGPCLGGWTGLGARGAPGAGLKERKEEMKAAFGGWLGSAQEASAALAPPPSHQGLVLRATAESGHGAGEGAGGSLAGPPCTTPPRPCTAPS